MEGDTQKKKKTMGENRKPHARQKKGIQEEGNSNGSTVQKSIGLSNYHMSGISGGPNEKRPEKEASSHSIAPGYGYDPGGSGESNIATLMEVSNAGPNEGKKKSQKGMNSGVPGERIKG